MKKAAIVLAMVMGSVLMAQPAVADDAATAEPAVVVAEAPAEAKAPDPPPEPPTPEPLAPEPPTSEDVTSDDSQAPDNNAKKAEEPEGAEAAAKPEAAAAAGQVVVCKFTGTPPGTLTEIIIVNANALGKDWDGLFPADFNDAQASFALRYAEDGEEADDISLAECGGTPPFDQCPLIPDNQPEGTICDVIVDDEDQVVVCKFTGTPPGTFHEVIIVNESALGQDWDGLFPADFNDAHGSFAIRYAAEGEQAGDVDEAACLPDPFDQCPLIPGDQAEGTDCDVIITDDEDQVVVCKFTGAPPGTFHHIIIVNESALGQDWDGLFPADFNDAHGSYAIRYAKDGEQAGDVNEAECDEPGGLDPEDQGLDPEEDRLLPDTGGSSLDLLLMAVAMTAAGSLLLMRRSPAAAEAAPVRMSAHSLTLPPMAEMVRTREAWGAVQPVRLMTVRERVVTTLRPMFSRRRN